MLQNDILKKYCQSYTDSWNDLIDIWNKYLINPMKENDLNEFFVELEKIIKNADIKINNLNVESSKTYKGRNYGRINS